MENKRILCSDNSVNYANKRSLFSDIRVPWNDLESLSIG